MARREEGWVSRLRPVPSVTLTRSMVADFPCRLFYALCMSDPHQPSEQIAYLTTDELHRQIQTRQLSSREIVETLGERIAAVDRSGTRTSLNAIAAMSDVALAIADECDQETTRGLSRGPLHGIPVLIKDNIEAVGLPGSAGSTALVGRTARDAELVVRLKRAGAIIFGSTNLSEWANIRSPRFTSGYSATGGLVGNPWALDRSAGGSSSGSAAALAAAFAPLTVGTETDGSIVCPSSVNGVVGLKPTVGQVPTTHVVPICSSQDSPGPMGRTVDDVARLYAVLAARVPVSVERPPVGVAATTWRTEHPQTDRLFDDVVEMLGDAGLEIHDRALAAPSEREEEDELTVMLCELSDDLTDYLGRRPGGGVTCLAEVIAHEDRMFETEQRYFGHEYLIRSQSSGGRAGAGYAPARRRNLEWARDTCLVPGIEGADVIVAPAFTPAWKSDLVVGGDAGATTRATIAPAIAGWPIMSVPIGCVDGLPVAMAIVGRPDSEWTLIEMARRVEHVVALHAPLGRPRWAGHHRG